VFDGVLGFYYNLFYHLESIGMLDPCNDIHIFCLHTVFIPCINHHLSLWKQGWMKHSLRSEHGLSPEQLWTYGLQKISCSSSLIANEVFEILDENELDEYGIDWDGPSNFISEDDINIPETNSPLGSSDMDELNSFIQPLSHSNEYGIDLYQKTLQFISDKL
jgi:hypothetical protein